MTWKIGKLGSVVSVDPYEGLPVRSGHDDVDYYGGYLVAESIPTVKLANLIAAAPKMLALLKELVDIEGPQPGHVEWANKVNEVIREAEEGK